MSRAKDAEDGEVEAHPRRTAGLVGHAEAERTLLDAFRSGRMPHAWLIGGPAGIGKATLAYRLARFVLAHPDPAARDVQQAETLALDAEHHAFKQVAAQSHPDLFELRRMLGDTGKLRTVITVDDVRRANAFFGLTAAGEGGWRVCIVDTADELKLPEGANALLKTLEEPPARSLFLLLSHAPGRLLPTIRSRCRLLTLRALERDEVARAAAVAAGRAPDEPAVQAASAIAEGSVGRALALLEGDLLSLRQRVEGQLAKLPAIDDAALHAVGDAIAGTDPVPLGLFVETVRDWLSARLDLAGASPHRLARTAEVWDKVNRAARDAEVYNLERKPLVFSVFGWLSETAR